MNNILVSLIIPIYNAEKHLIKCVDSVLKQTHSNIEIILVNDGSNDRSLLMCEEYKTKDSRIKIVNQKNAGPSAARNRGILESQGDYLQFVDADDHIETTMVEELLSASQKGVDLVLCGYYKNTHKNMKVTPDNEGIYTLTKFMKYFPELFQKTLIHSPGNKLYNASIIKKNDIKFPLNINNGEDLMFNIYYLKNCEMISLIKPPLYHYNILVNLSSLTKTFKEEYFENRKKVFKKTSNFLEDYTEEFPAIINLLEKTSSNYIIASITNLFHKENKINSNEKKESLNKIVEDRWVRENIEIIEKGKIQGLLIRILLKYKLILGIFFYFNTLLIIKSNLKKFTRR